MNILKHIKVLLDEREWSVYELAKRSDIPQSTLSNMFNKSTYPTIPTLETICKGFGITLSEFFAEGKKLDELTFEEAQLLTKWNSLSIDKKNSLLELLKHL